MTDGEINTALAMAIGYRSNHVRIKYGMMWVFCQDDWSIFDFRDWNVIGPIAERYKCFPLYSRGEWRTWGASEVIYSDTPQKAVAMAVIKRATP